tara:strand:+ start:406 stop:924 length:519 start_codon:yes stop_codon:yes gene_type:complete
MKLLLEKWKQFLKEAEETTILPVSKVGNVTYDPQGVGSTPNGNNVDYLGFTVWMRTDDFIKLNPTRHDESEYLSSYFREADSIVVAPPFIVAKWKDDHWQVMGHEGRGRMIEVEKISPSSMVPVHIFPSGGNRARHLTEDMIFGKILSDQRSMSHWQVQPTTVVWQGKLFKK